MINCFLQLKICLQQNTLVITHLKQVVQNTWFIVGLNLRVSHKKSLHMM